MKATELKKIIRFSVENTCTVGELKDIKMAFKSFKTGVFNDFLKHCIEYIHNSLAETQMYIDDYADAEISAFSAEDYIIYIRAYASTLEGTYLHRHYHQVCAYFAFTFNDGTITPSCADPLVDVW